MITLDMPHSKTVVEDKVALVGLVEQIFQTYLRIFLVILVVEEEVEIKEVQITEVQI